MGCMLCPRRCGAERDGGTSGICHSGGEMRVGRVALHPWEEPPISGTNGSGTIFFSGCNLGCVYCQNRAISRGGAGKTVSEDELASAMLSLQEQGAHNINLVTAGHYLPAVARVLRRVKPNLKIPVVYNTSSYESAKALSELRGLVDIYLPDFKYASSAIAERYSSAPDYPLVAREALAEMFSQVGGVVFDGEGLLKKGMVVRHLVLPSCRRDSMAVLELLADLLPVEEIRLSLMSQYTPEFAKDSPYSELHRNLTSFEYNSVLRHAEALGFEGYFQGRSSASSSFTPNFEE